MARVEGSVMISAPIQTVWELLADPRRHTEFGTFVDQVSLMTDGPVRKGTVYRERSGPDFMKSESEWTVTTFDPPHALAHVGRESSMNAEATWMLDQIDSGSTRVTQALDFEMMPGFRPLGRLLERLFAKRLMQHETARMLSDIKRLAEVSDPGSS